MSVHAALATRPLVLASAGIGVVGASFGMARYGFGLLAPDIRASFGLDEQRDRPAGRGLLHHLPGHLDRRRHALGPARRPQGRRRGRRVRRHGDGDRRHGREPRLLFAGLLVAGASAGLVFPPFSDVVSRSLAPDRRARVLAAISSGTGWGVALAVPIALLAGESWRTAWLLFAVAAALATGWALAVLPAVDKSAPGTTSFGCGRAGSSARAPSPLLAGALLVGLGSSVYWTFAVEQLQSQGGLSSANSRIVLAVVGLSSIAGTASADAVRHLGARAAFVLAAVAEAVSLALLGLAPGTLVVALCPPCSSAPPTTR